MRLKDEADQSRDTCMDMSENCTLSSTIIGDLSSRRVAKYREQLPSFERYHPILAWKTRVNEQWWQAKHKEFKNFY